MFGVIEHLPDPVSHVQIINRLLKPGGRLVIDTDNFNDIIMMFENEHINEFYFRTVHNWYFTSETLANVLEMGGLKVTKRDFVHRYDLGNTLSWLAHQRPTGNGSIPIIPQSINALWQEFLCQSGKAELIFLEAKLPS